MTFVHILIFLRYKVQLDIVTEILEQVLGKLTIDEVAELSRKFNHTRLDSQHVTGLTCHRKHYNLTELHDLLHLIVHKGGKTVM